MSSNLAPAKPLAQFLTTADVADRWQLTRNGVLFHVTTGRLRPAGKIGRAYVFAVDEVERVEALTRKATA